MSFDQKSLTKIGVVHSPFKEKFGLPRQASLIKSCSAELELFSPFNTTEYVKGLDEFSDIWLIFGFHQHEQSKPKPLVRPPRLGGNKKTGVFASRSPFRPNGLGLSRVQLLDIENIDNKIRLIISCPDMVDGTPIYDIKPYIHYSDSNENALCGFAQVSPEKLLTVKFTQNSIENLSTLSKLTYPKLQETIIELLSLNPSPAYKKSTSKQTYGIKLYDLNIIWEQSNHEALVQSISKC